MNTRRREQCSAYIVASITVASGLHVFGLLNKKPSFRNVNVHVSKEMMFLELFMHTYMYYVWNYYRCTVICKNFKVNYNLDQIILLTSDLTPKIRPAVSLTYNVENLTCYRE